MKIPPGLNVIYADRKLVVVDKPSGLLSVPGRGPENQDCVVTRVQAMFPECRKFPTVHRLDMDTSGLLVLGLTARAQRELSQQFHDREVSKRYVAVLDGLVTRPEGVIDLPLRMDRFNRPYQVYDPIHGRRAVTEWRRLSVENGRTRVEFSPHTGRTHQLRMHSAHPLGLGCPIVGDRLYGSGTGPGQLLLHAGYLRFMHPKTKEMMEFFTEPSF
ncbi:RluA family pseudouridine synthase [Pseudodesulfovibrio tunisiensis]|uniref:RluA family pseudouridine synthase n=1 Tax=Pseudodesulfovibrio tunisiensis TaxID=463192 RepID=UPI001FB4BB9E|nr:RluA family pseudouridine synthase [Pseudodesulfovibrio tunisiensis]